MKKISLKSLGLNEVEQLSRAQLKAVMGGFVGSGGGSGSFPGGKYQCCPESIGSGVGCSNCVEFSPGQNWPTCQFGELVAC